MASNEVATAQRIIWEQFHEHRPARLMAAISERCGLAVADEETMTQKIPAVDDSITMNQGRNRGMSI